ncbi:MAG TPA: hypothetical protein VH333_25095 [Pseudonocardiaceae bacterium]|nr:hypothetical protein [Pseudonocardiaceae bacterium]
MPANRLRSPSIETGSAGGDGLAGEHFDDPAGDVVAGVAVGHHRAERVVLRQVGAGGHVAGQRVVAASGVQNVVACDP